MAPIDAIVLLSTSHQEALKSTAKLQENRFAVEVRSGSFGIRTVDAQGVAYRHQATTTDLPDTASIWEGWSRGAS